MKISRRIEQYFFTGLLSILPLFISGYLLFVLFRFIDGILGRLINIYFIRNFGIYIPGLGLILFLLIILFVGFLSTHLVGKGFKILVDRTARRFPVLRHVYPTVKQAVEFFLPGDKLAAKKIVLVEYPSKGIWSMGFLTGEDFKEIQKKSSLDLLNVYIPSVPNPATGFLVFVPRKDIIFLDIDVKNAMRLIVSGGLLCPSAPMEETKKIA